MRFEFEPVPAVMVPRMAGAQYHGSNICQYAIEQSQMMLAASSALATRPHHVHIH
jgi:hypothetical protein